MDGREGASERERKCPISWLVNLYISELECHTMAGQVKEKEYNFSVI